MVSEVKHKLIGERENLIKQLSSYKSEDPLRDPKQSSSRPLDDAITVSEGHDRIEATRVELKIRLSEVEAALAKIDSGKYGVCEKCGEKIGSERLKAIATATRCRKCEGKK